MEGEEMVLAFSSKVKRCNGRKVLKETDTPYGWTLWHQPIVFKGMLLMEVPRKGGGLHQLPW